MQKRTIYFLTGIGFLLGMNIIAQGCGLIHKKTDIQTIILAHQDAMGGLENWRTLRNYSLKYKKDSGWTSEIKALMPDQLRIDFQDVEGGSLSKVYDGQHGYLVRNGAYEQMRPGEMIEMAEEPVYYSELMFASEGKGEINYKGLERLSGRECHRIELIKNERDTQTYWVATDDYLIYMTGEYSEDKAHEGIYYKTRLEDYREIEGLMFPFRQTLIPSKRDSIISFVESFSPNVNNIDEDNFTFKPASTRDLIAYWKDRYASEAIPGFSFIQETIQFRGDGSKDTSTWHEAIVYPDKFRIDFGPQENGNTNLYRNDSLYIFRNDSLRASMDYIQEFMIMEGGIYANPVDTTLAMLDNTGVNSDLFHENSYKGRPCYVIGAEKGDLSRSQVWLDKERRSSVRRFSRMNDGRLMEVRYGRFEEFNGYEIETWLEFFVDGSLIQTERYYNLEVNPHLPKGTFDPASCLNSYWY